MSRGSAKQLCKRAFDLVVTIPALIVLTPVFVPIAMLIKLDSRGPIFFRQVRVGRNRRLFRMWKFRKMYHDLPVQGPNLTRRGDSRLTRIGRLLERTKLDELPQFLNVLVGDMSLVGPRPEVPPFVAHYPEQWDVVLAVTPGIFGPCQIRFRNESELYPPDCTDVESYYIQHILPAKLAIDAEYASRFRLLGDVAILIRAVWASVGGIVTRQTFLHFFCRCRAKKQICRTDPN
ncbi:MAG: sugar transferase [Gemmataceae bacterium]